MARAERPPSFQFYPKDFRADADVQAMTFDQRGRYIWALCASWDTESPGAATEDQWRRWMQYTVQEWPDHRDAVLACFKVEGDTWLQERMIAERLRQFARYVQAQNGAHIANAKRTHSARTAPAQRTDSARTAPAPSSSSSVSSSIASSDKQEPEQPKTLALSLNGSGPESPEFLTFPCVGKGPDAYRITEAGVQRLAALFPGPDVRQSLRNALAWILANPAKRKTARGMDRFVTGWLTRDQESGRVPRQAVGAGLSNEDRAAAMVAAMNGGKP